MALKDVGRSGPGEAAEVSENVYAYVQHDGSWWINNTGFMVGSRGVVSVDACSTEARTRAYLDTIAKVSDQPVRTLVNTHHHGDHTFGNYLFPAATIVGQERSRAAMQAWGPPRSAPFWTDVEWGDVELAPPFLTFDESVTVHVDDLRCEVRHLGLPAHTDNDASVWLPERKVVFAGDLVFRDVTPFVVQGSLGGMLETLAAVEQLGAETVVPGHGRVCGPEVFGDVMTYLRFVQDVAAGGVAAGISPWRPRSTRTSVSSPTCWTVSGSSATSIVRMRRSAASCGALHWTLPPLLPTWSPTTTGSR